MLFRGGSDAITRVLGDLVSGIVFSLNSSSAREPGGHFPKYASA
jgi:hypothetical protein